MKELKKKPNENHVEIKKLKEDIDHEKLKAKRRVYQKELYAKTKDKRSSYQREYYNGRGKEWYLENKERLLKLRKERYKLEKLDIQLNVQRYHYQKQYYKDNRDEINKKRREKAKALRTKVVLKEEDKTYDQKYYELNKDRILETKRIKYQNKKESNSI